MYEDFGGSIFVGGEPHSLVVLNLHNITFQENKGGQYGGAVYVDQIQNLTIENCSFISNSAVNSGAAIYLKDIKNNTQINNTNFL